MRVYVKNVWGQQTVRELPVLQAIKLRLYCWHKYLNKEERPVVRFLL